LTEIAFRFHENMTALDAVGAEPRYRATEHMVGATEEAR
jgi:hypothetical protein